MIFQTVNSCIRRACSHEDGGMIDGSFGFYLMTPLNLLHFGELLKITQHQVIEACIVHKCATMRCTKKLCFMRQNLQKKACITTNFPKLTFFHWSHLILIPYLLKKAGKLFCFYCDYNGL